MPEAAYLALKKKEKEKREEDLCVSAPRASVVHSVSD